MRKIIAMLLLIPTTAACSKVQNSFEIYAGDGVLSSATLSLCGSEIRLMPFHQRLRAAMQIGCEGYGTLHARYAGGAAVECPVGPVSPQAYRHWRFRAEQGRCERLPQ